MKEYNYTFLVQYHDGTSSEFYEIACNKKQALQLLEDELDDRIWDYVKHISVIKREVI